MGGILVPYVKLAQKRMEHQALAEIMKTNLEKILSTGCLIQGFGRRFRSISRQSSATKKFICAGSWEKDRIRYYHRQDEGYAGRKPLDPRDLGPGDQVQ